MTLESTISQRSRKTGVLPTANRQTLVNSPAAMALFVYNRPQHTQAVLAALSANRIAPLSDLWIFSDDAKDSSDETAVSAVRQIVANQKGFRRIHLVCRQKNWGLFGNITEGIHEAFTQTDRLIVLEDDIIPTGSFLGYMNKALEFYANVPAVFSVSAYAYPLGKTFQPQIYDTFCLERFSCWGWGIWKDRWDSVNWQIPKSRRELFAETAVFRRFHEASNDLPEILLDRIESKNQSWSIHVAWDMVRTKRFCVHPFFGFVTNIGFDGTGTHAPKSAGRKAWLSPVAKTSYRFNQYYSHKIATLYQGFFENSWRRRLKNLVSYGLWF